MNAGPTPRSIDGAALPSYSFGHRNLMWWGTIGLIAIESTVFALAIATYLYLRSHTAQWPPSGVPPALRWGSLNTAVLLLSCWPNHRLKQAAEACDLRGVRVWLLACMACSAAFLVVRVFEFDTLNVRWDTDAYGSIVWMLMGLHTVHLVTDTYDTGVLAVLFFTGPLERQRFVDVSENAVYWYFVVLSWLPIYAVVYWMPRSA